MQLLIGRRTPQHNLGIVLSSRLHFQRIGIYIIFTLICSAKLIEDDHLVFPELYIRLKVMKHICKVHKAKDNVLSRGHSIKVIKESIY